MSNQCEVKLIWLPAHSGIQGNETADNIAKKAARMPNVGAEPITAIDKKLPKKIADTSLIKKLENSWRVEQRCEHTKYFVRNMDTKQLMKMPKSEIRICIGLITGHCSLNYHLNKLRMRDDPDCDLCGRENETARHIVCDCLGLATIRMQTFAVPKVNTEDICKHSLHKLVTFYKKCSEKYYHLSRAF